MNKSKELPDKNNVLRLFKPKHFRIDNQNPDRKIGVLGDAFTLRESDKGKLSCTWIEYFQEKSSYTTSESLAIEATANCLEFSKSAGFAVLEVENIKSAGALKNKKFRVIHNPQPNCKRGPNLGHALITNIPERDGAVSDLFELLASTAVSKVLDVKGDIIVDLDSHSDNGITEN